MVWQVQDTLKLIHLYKNTPELWDCEHPNYKNRIVRRRTYEKLAEQMHSSPPEVEKKLKGIRTQFAREHARELSGQKSIWFGYQPLLFLSKYNKNFLLDDIKNEQWLDLEDIDEIEIVDADDAENFELNTDVDSFKFVDPNSICGEWSSKHRLETNKLPGDSEAKRTSESDKSMMKKLRKISPEISSNYSINDEHTAFANCVSHKLRSIKSPRARSVAQYFINWVLFQAEMTNYEEDFEFESPPQFNLFKKKNQKD